MWGWYDVLMEIGEVGVSSTNCRLLTCWVIQENRGRTPVSLSNSSDEFIMINQVHTVDTYKTDSKHTPGLSCRHHKQRHSISNLGMHKNVRMLLHSRHNLVDWDPSWCTSSPSSWNCLVFHTNVDLVKWLILCAAVHIATSPDFTLQNCWTSSVCN